MGKLMTENERECLMNSNKMMVADEKALSNSNIPEPFKELIRKEMRNQQDLIEVMEWEKDK